jgi:hypothetical protein
MTCLCLSRCYLRCLHYSRRCGERSVGLSAHVRRHWPLTTNRLGGWQSGDGALADAALDRALADA